MSAIHEAILNKLQAQLQLDLIDNVPVDDKSRAGLIVLGPLQGDPMDPDAARISVELHENDPDYEDYEWEDLVADDEDGGLEIGGAITWHRRFTIRARCLLERTQENLAQTKAIASQVRSRLEDSLLKTQFGGLSSGNEYVSRGVLSQDIVSKMVQNGGPGAYDYLIFVRFDVLTTKTGVQE
jgi:hypothetical protein